MKEKLFRLLAYLLDNMLVGVICLTLSYISFLNPNREMNVEMYLEINEISTNIKSFSGDLNKVLEDNIISNDEFIDNLSKYSKYDSVINISLDKEINSEEKEKIISNFKKELQEKYNDLSYKVQKSKISETVILIVVSILYFGILQYFAKGQTVFKKLFKLKIVTNDDENISIRTSIGRSLIANEIIFQIVTVLSLLILAKSNYITFASCLYFIQYAFDFAMCLVFVMRSDNRGIHDLIFKTKVIGINDEKNTN